MNYQPYLSNEIIVDNFAGGGGASIGIERALGHPINIAINHDQEAIAMHRMNHPQTKHFCEDVYDVNPREICKGRKVKLAWFSPDCKHFSKAKGGKLLDRRIRGLAWVVMRWASLPQNLKPRIIMLENVEEFVTWGPLKKGKICQKRKGKNFKIFVNHLIKLGYDVKWRELVAAHYGAPTSRKRLFLIARSDGKQIIWPKPTHGNEKDLKPFKTAADCIDWSIICPSIFSRKRPLAENTLKRIAKGLKKFVFECKYPFILSEDKTPLATASLTECANASSQRVFDIKEPLRTQCAGVKGGHFALVAAFLAKHFTGATGSDLTAPCPTIVSKGTQINLVTGNIVKMRGKCTGSALNEPLHTISAGGTHHAEVRAFLLKYYGADKHGAGMNDPLHTISTKDRFGLVTIKGEEYKIIDIGMRMLAPKELYKAQSFPDSYIFDKGRFKNEDGSYEIKPLKKVSQTRMCGNSVPPIMSEVLVKANIDTPNIFANYKQKGDV